MAGLVLICICLYVYSQTCHPQFSLDGGLSASKSPSMACQIKSNGVSLPRNFNSTPSSYPLAVNNILAGDTGVASGTATGNYTMPTPTIEDFS